uniref:Uncharacterized protein n=1 Tax=viral metagenome TaxID=1070528 RepID=A0A6M3M3W7_9ZZZZ
MAKKLPRIRDSKSGRRVFTPRQIAKRIKKTGEKVVLMQTCPFCRGT